MWVFTNIIILLILFLGYPIIGGKLILSLVKKNWTKVKSNIIRLSLLIIFSGLVFEILPGSKLFWRPINAFNSVFETKKLVGYSFILPEPVLEKSPDRHFNGDGKSFLIYYLDQSNIEELIIPESSFFTQYPQNEIFQTWEIKTWNKTPIKEDDKKAFSFASYACDSEVFNLKKILEEEGHYYAYKYRSSNREGRTYFTDIDFYIISPRRKMLINLNVNT